MPGTIHDLRREWISIATEVGLPLVLAKAAVGHSIGALFALARFALAWLAWYLGRAAGMAASSFREGYSTARVAAEEVTADDVLLRACNGGHARR